MNKTFIIQKHKFYIKSTFTFSLFEANTLMLYFYLQEFYSRISTWWHGSERRKEKEGNTEGSKEARKERLMEGWKEGKTREETKKEGRNIL